MSKGIDKNIVFLTLFFMSMVYGMEKPNCSIKAVVKSLNSEKEITFTENEYNNFCAARRLADLVSLAAEQLSPNVPHFFRKKEIHPGEHMLKQGLFLKYDFQGTPRSIYTIFGQVNLNSRAPSKPGDEKPHVGQLLKLGVEMLPHGGIVNLYEVKSIEGRGLLPAIYSMLDNFQRPMRFKEKIKSKWEAMEEHYELSLDM